MKHPRRLAVVRLEDRLTPATATWDGGGANNLWMTPQNWVGDVAPHAGDDLVFGTAAQRANVNDFAPGTSFRSITLNDSGYQISGNAISLTAGINAASQVGTSTLSMDIVLGADQTIANTAAVGFQIAGNIDLNGHVLTATINGGSPGGGVFPPFPGIVTMSGVIHGNGGLIKDGVQILVLSGNNSFTGPIDDRSGTLSFGSNNAGGAAGSGNGTMVEAGAVLAINLTNLVIPEPITFAARAPSNQNPLSVFSTGGANQSPVTFTGPVTLTGASRWLGDVALAGGLVGTGSLSIQGSLTFPTGTVSTYNGSLNAETRPFVFDGSGPTGQITANDSQGVLGTGSIGSLTIQGSNTHLTPGDNGIGTLTTGRLIEGAQFDVEIGNAGADMVVVNGAVALGGTLTVFPESGFTPPANAVYRIIDNDGTDFASGSFGGLTQGAVVTTINGVTLYINYRGGDGNDVELTTTQPPPLPGPRPFYSVGAGAGGGPHVKVYDESGSLVYSFLAYEASFTGGVHVATADVTGDGIRDIITAPGAGGGTLVRIWDGATGKLTKQYYAYDPNFRGGAFVAAARIDNDFVADVVTGAGPGGGPHVRVFLSTSPNFPTQFLAYDPAFSGGVRVAAFDGHVSGGNFIEGTVVTSPGAGGGPHVRTFNGVSAGPLTSFLAYDPSFTGGVYVAAGDLNGDGKIQIITGPGPSAAPQINAFDPQTGQLLLSFNAYDANFRGGVTVGVTSADASGRAELVTGAGPGGGPHVKTWRVTIGYGQPVVAPFTLKSFFAFDPSFLGGVFVG